MKRLATLMIIIVTVAVGGALLLPVFMRAHAYSGPSVFSNLSFIQTAKDRWEVAGHTNEWPTAQDLDLSVDGRSVNKAFRHRWGELYFINRTGAPPFVYIPKPAGSYRGGEILVLTPKGLSIQHQ